MSIPLMNNNNLQAVLYFNIFMKVKFSIIYNVNKYILCFKIKLIKYLIFFYKKWNILFK